MTRITKIEPGTGRAPKSHDLSDDVACTYHVIVADDGSKLVHLTAEGKKFRFSMQFDKGGAGQLLEIFTEAEVLDKLPIHWDRIDADGFERLLARLLDLSDGYTQVNRLIHVNGQDAGRDIEAYLKVTDGLGAYWLERVFVQAKHWPAQGVNSSEIADLIHSKIPLWEGDPVRRLIIATTGWFTQDGVRWVENHNRAANRPAIILWSSNELEQMLTRWPTLAGEFGLIGAERHSDDSTSTSRPSF